MTENRPAQKHTAPKPGAEAAQGQAAPAAKPAQDNAAAAKAAPEIRPAVTAEAAASNRKSFFKRP